jgi:hypothetical protein
LHRLYALIATMRTALLILVITVCADSCSVAPRAYVTVARVFALDTYTNATVHLTAPRAAATALAYFDSWFSDQLAVPDERCPARCLVAVLSLYRRVGSNVSFASVPDYLVPQYLSDGFLPTADSEVYCAPALGVCASRVPLFTVGAFTCYAWRPRPPLWLIALVAIVLLLPAAVVVRRLTRRPLSVLPEYDSECHLPPSVASVDSIYPSYVRDPRGEI